MEFDKYQNGTANIPLPILLKLDGDVLKLYALILTLTNWKGYCWAKNDYFSEVLNCSIATIKRQLKALKDEQLITIEGNTNHRKIFVKQVQTLNKLGSDLSRAKKTQLTGEPKLGSDLSLVEKDTLYINNNIINNNKDLCQVGQNKDSQLKEVFEYWATVMNHQKSKLDPKRKKAISNALSWGYSVDDLKTAIAGCSCTPHNMGDNDRNQRYDGLELILRNADQIDRFMHNSLEPPVNDSKATKRQRANLASLREFIGKEGG